MRMQQPAPAWALRYLGKPWLSGGQGPHAFDCWGFARYVQRQYFYRPVAEIIVDSDDVEAMRDAFLHHPERQQWDVLPVTAQRVDGDLVLAPLHAADVHVGVWTNSDGGRIVQCVRGSGVIASSLQQLATFGCARPHFYRWKGTA